MSTFRHPAFPKITHTVPDDRDDEALAAGWEPLEPETAPQETSTACGEEAATHPSGLGKFRRESE